MENKWEPLAHRVLVQLEEVGETAGGAGIIVRPEMNRDREQRQLDKGFVVEIGPQAFVGFGDGTPWCGVGDHVAFAKHAGVLMEDDGKFFRIINDEDLYARLRK